VIRILITTAAFAALGGTDAAAQRAEDGSGRYGAAPEGQVAIWLEKPVLEALRAARGQGESLSDTILRLADAEKEAA
jgi:hypothetical protein